MTLEQFEEYMNKVEDYAARRVEEGLKPYLCHCFNLTTQSHPCRPAMIALVEWFRPKGCFNHDAWMDEANKTLWENIDSRITAFFLFEAICISEELYKEFDYED